MKIKPNKIALACALLGAANAYAESKDSFEFHGYFRSGSLYSVENDLAKSMFPAQKETLGRLGIESDDFWELAFFKNWELDDGKKIRIKTRLGAQNMTGDPDATEQLDAMLGTSIDAKNTGLIEAYVEFEGLTDTGVFWGGRRYYGRDNYIFMTDFFYTDWSGTGLGVEGMKLGGDMTMDLAYVASDRSTLNFFTGENNPLHLVHAAIGSGGFEAHFVAKYMADNFVGGTEFANSGFETALMYGPQDFFGIGKGFSKVALQLGQGLGAGQMLGASLTNYNAFSPGAGRNEGQAALTRHEDDDASARIVAYGGYFGIDNILLFPSFQAQYNDYEDGGTDQWWSFMVRPVFTMPSVDNFFLAMEIGYTANEYENADGSDGESYDYKVTISPTWTVNTGMGPSPEIRLLATYLPGDEDSDLRRDESDFIVGVQADMWW